MFGFHKAYDITGNIIAYEQGDLDEDGVVTLFQHLVDNGTVWHMQGSMGRAAMDMIRSGECVLGVKSFRDYWGNVVPSRTDVKPGTLGSVAYAEARREHEAY